MATPTTLPAAFTAGQVLTAAQMNDLRGAFRVLQVVNFYLYSAGTSTSSSTYTATGLTATITPTSASSKILITFSQSNRKDNSSATTEAASRIHRNGSNILGATNFSSCYTNSLMELRTMVSGTYLDSPATTAATTYTLYGSAQGGGLASFDFFAASSITLMEISA